MGRRRRPARLAVRALEPNRQTTHGPPALHPTCANEPPVLYAAALVPTTNSSEIQQRKPLSFQALASPLPSPTTGAPARAGRSLFTPQVRQAEPGAPAGCQQPPEAPRPPACPACQPYFIRFNTAATAIRWMRRPGAIWALRLMCRYFFLHLVSHTHCHATRVLRVPAAPWALPQGAFRRGLASAHCLLLFCLLLPNRNTPCLLV